MTNYIAQFVGTDSEFEKITCVAHTPNYAIQGVWDQLRMKLREAAGKQVKAMMDTGSIPEHIVLSEFERDACAVLYGSDDLRPHITVRTLPPHA